MTKKFPNYRQLDAMDCGPTCIRIIAKYYGKTYSLETLRNSSHFSREGVSMLGISDAAESIGFRTMGVKVDYEKLKKDAPIPFIAHWKQSHFIVVYGFKRGNVLISDPSYGLMEIPESEFLSGWISSRNESKNLGLVMFLSPTPDFYLKGEQQVDKSKLNYLANYLKPYKRFIIQLFIGLFVGSLLQLTFPFLTQAIVDFGIQNQNLNFVILILIAQIVLFTSNASVQYIRSWILLHLGARINISLLSDFLVKLMKLPISFFDTKQVGDLLQRIEDHKRIEHFLTSSSLDLIFGFVNLIVFGFVLVLYSLQIFTVFLVGSAIYVFWILLFLRKRKELDHRKFSQMAKEQSNVIQLITGMQEIKLHNSERKKRWEWERLQAGLFKLNMDSLSLGQYQTVGSSFINELKNIILSFIAAKAVIEGSMTLGMMMAVQFIIGQLNAPIQQFVTFLHSAQDAKISLERLGEIHNSTNEEDNQESKITTLPENGSLKLENVSFQYGGPHSEFALRNVSLHIPQGKVTAIVGASGSGKTTLLKLLLKFYKPTNGRIDLGEVNLDNYNNAFWRDACGAVLQDGFIFSDTIARNIAVSDEYPDMNKLLYAIKVANIKEFIDSLPLAYNTKIGSDGHGLSQGQKQRVLIARAVYKSPRYLFFDEATNALDANNEKVIMENLSQFYEGRTVVVVAHRLSTVKNADQIIVLNKGVITEVGNHKDLITGNSQYYQLVKNQLELGN